MPDPQLPQAPQIPQAQNPRGIVPADPNRVKSVLGFFTDPHSLGNGAELDRGPLGNSAIRVLDLIARAGGASSPIEGAMARYQQGVQQRKAQFTQNLEMLGRLGGVLEELPLSRRGGAAEQLRKRFSADFGGPGSEVLFDAVLGDLELAPGVLSQLQKDPEIRGLLANPLASGADLEAIASSPEFRERAVARQDVELLPGITQKLQRLFREPPDEWRAEYERLRDGGITVAEIRRLNELAGQGPAGGALTPAELSTLERRQGDIAARFPNFVTTERFEAEQERLEKKRDSELAFQDFLRKYNVEQKGRMDIARVREEQSRFDIDPSTGQRLPKLSSTVERQLAEISGDERSAREIQTQAMSALQMLESYTRNTATGTGVVAAAKSQLGSLAPETQNLEAALNELAVRKVIAVAKEAGARSADSDAERSAIASTAPSIGKDETVNRRIILGMASQAARSEFLSRAKQEHIRRVGSLVGFDPKAIDGRIETIFNPATADIIVIEKGAPIPENWQSIRDILMPARSGASPSRGDRGSSVTPTTPEAAAPEQRRARTPDGREVTVERGEDGKWHEVTP